MKILVDADGCPVVGLTESLAREFGLDLLIFVDSSHVISSDYGEVFVVAKGKDAVDFELVKYVEPGDVVVTGDYGLASMVLAKNGRAIGNSGLVYTRENIDDLLGVRHLNGKLRKMRVKTRKVKPRTKDLDARFEIAFRGLMPERG